MLTSCGGVLLLDRRVYDVRVRCCPVGYIGSLHNEAVSIMTIYLRLFCLTYTLESDVYKRHSPCLARWPHRFQWRKMASFVMFGFAQRVRERHILSLLLPLLLFLHSHPFGMGRTEKTRKEGVIWRIYTDSSNLSNLELLCNVVLKETGGRFFISFIFFRNKCVTFWVLYFFTIFLFWDTR